MRHARAMAKGKALTSAVFRTRPVIETTTSSGAMMLPAAIHAKQLAATFPARLRFCLDNSIWQTIQAAIAPKGDLQLSDSILKFGAGEGIRTLDPNLGKVRRRPLTEAQAVIPLDASPRAIGNSWLGKRPVT